MAELSIVDAQGDGLATQALELVRRGARRIVLHPWNETVRAIAAAIKNAEPAAQVVGGPEPRIAADLLEQADAVIVTSIETDAVDDTLLQLVDRTGLRVVAPRTAHYFRSRPLFLVSIPKSGTHLLYKLVESFGYDTGIAADEFARPGTWYCVEYSNSHTLARDFFVDSVRRSPFGNRHHPFATSPALFIYRNPLDVLVSEANYYHQEGKTAFAGYLSGLDFEQRVERLMNDPWLLGSIRDRIGGFAPWLDFPNVIPLSFEEMVGAEGGGSREEQLRLIWSLQLKLQVPGDPRAFADSVFDRNSPTFYQGRIGGWRSSLSGEHMARFRALDQDFMNVFGYDLDPAPGAMPRRAAEFRHRPLRVPPSLHDGVPIALEYNHLGFNLVRFSGWIYAIPQAVGPGFSLLEQQEPQLAMLPRERTLAGLKHRLLVDAAFWGGNANAMMLDLSARLSGRETRRAFKNTLRATARGLLAAGARLLGGGKSGQ